MAIIVSNLKREIAIRELAFDICVNRIAKAFSKCEFRTYENNTEVKDNLYYLLNVSPNPNQNATEFWESVIDKYYHEAEVLIFSQKVNGNDYLYVADSFDIDDTKILREWIFKNVRIGKMKLNKTLKMHEVFYFKMTNKKVLELLRGITDLYADLIKLSYNNINQNSGVKLKLKIDDFRSNDNEEIETILNEDARNFFRRCERCISGI